MRVMQVKYNSRVKNNQVNSRKLFALGFTNTGGIKKKNCEKDVNIPNAPSHQQGYGIYLKRATMGIAYGGGGIGTQSCSGLASKVVGKTFTDSNFNRGEQQQMMIFKRTPEFSTSNYIKNKKSKVIREINIDCNGNTISKSDPICNNINYKNGSYTQDLGYLSAQQKIDKKVATRVCAAQNSDYESQIMKNTSCSNA